MYYGDGFDDCPKQVRSIYPNLNISNVTMDEPVLTTPADGDTVDEKIEDFILAEQDLKDNGVMLAQPALERPVSIVILSAKDPLLDAENPSTQVAQNPPPKDDENSSVQDVQNP